MAAAGLEGPSSLANYEIDLDQVKSKLGHFIARHVTCTTSGEAGSRILLLHAETNGEKFADDIFVSPSGQSNDALRRSASQSPAALAKALRALADDIANHKMVPPGPWGSLRTSTFRWPVFGASGQREDTPAEFIDRCAAWIHGSGGIPVSVGAQQARPDRSILSAFHHGHALDLIQVYDAEQKSLRSAARRSRSHLKLVNSRG